MYDKDDLIARVHDAFKGKLLQKAEQGLHLDASGIPMMTNESFKYVGGILDEALKEVLPDGDSIAFTCAYVVEMDAGSEEVCNSLFSKLTTQTKPGAIIRLTSEEMSVYQSLLSCPPPPL